MKEGAQGWTPFIIDSNGNGRRDEHVEPNQPLDAKKDRRVMVNGKWINLRVPYPNGYFTKWVEGRIDDPNAGWKGKSLWTTHSTRTVFHMEGGTANRPKVVRFQLRPDPLAK